MPKFSKWSSNPRFVSKYHFSDLKLLKLGHLLRYWGIVFSKLPKSRKRFKYENWVLQEIRRRRLKFLVRASA